MRFDDFDPQLPSGDETRITKGGDSASSPDFALHDGHHRNMRLLTGLNATERSSAPLNSGDVRAAGRILHDSVGCYAELRSLLDIRAALYELMERISFQRAINRVYGDAQPGLPSPEEELQLDMRAARLEERYGDAGPYTDFQWGMLNGKLSALRWVFGNTWDDLDL